VFAARTYAITPSVTVAAAAAEGTAVTHNEMSTVATTSRRAARGDRDMTTPFTGEPMVLRWFRNLKGPGGGADPPGVASPDGSR
jgi:hypothetical protein